MNSVYFFSFTSLLFFMCSDIRLSISGVSESTYWQAPHPAQTRPNSTGELISTVSGWIFFLIVLLLLLLLLFLLFCYRHGEKHIHQLGFLFIFASLSQLTIASLSTRLMRFNHHHFNSFCMPSCPMTLQSAKCCFLIPCWPLVAQQTAPSSVCSSMA